MQCCVVLDESAGYSMKSQDDDDINWFNEFSSGDSSASAIEHRFSMEIATNTHGAVIVINLHSAV